MFSILKRISDREDPFIEVFKKAPEARESFYGLYI